jgi:hypothetical protein
VPAFVLLLLAACGWFDAQFASPVYATRERASRLYQKFWPVLAPLWLDPRHEDPEVEARRRQGVPSGRLRATLHVLTTWDGLFAWGLLTGRHDYNWQTHALLTSRRAALTSFDTLRTLYDVEFRYDPEAYTEQGPCWDDLLPEGTLTTWTNPYWANDRRNAVVQARRLFQETYHAADHD